MDCEGGCGLRAHRLKGRGRQVSQAIDFLKFGLDSVYMKFIDLHSAQWLPPAWPEALKQFGNRISFGAAAVLLLVLLG